MSNTPGGGPRRKLEDQPDAKQLANEPGVPMPSSIKADRAAPDTWNQLLATQVLNAMWTKHSDVAVPVASGQR